MRQIDVHVFLNIFFDTLPIVPVIAYFFTPHADRDQFGYFHQFTDVFNMDHSVFFGIYLHGTDRDHDVNPLDAAVFLGIDRSLSPCGTLFLVEIIDAAPDYAFFAIIGTPAPFGSLKRMDTFEDISGLLVQYALIRLF
jgi:hypothetical protein